MKIALLLSGQPRFVEESLKNPCYHYFQKNIIQKYDCDVFCHYWWSDDPNQHYETAPWSGLGTLKISSQIPELITELYQPKSQKHEPPLSFQQVREMYPHYFKYETPKTIYNHISMYTSLKRCWQLFDEYAKYNKIDYDFVIRCRYDSVVDIFPDLTKLDKTKVHVTKDHRNQTQVNHSWISSHALSEYTFGMIEHIDKALSIQPKFNDEVFMFCMLIDIRKQGLVNNIDKSELTTKLYRGNGNIPDEGI